MPSQGGETALVWASSKGRESVVRALLDARADVRARDSVGWTALMWAIDNGHGTVVKLLLDAGADARDVDDDGNHALELAELQEDADVAALLREAISVSGQGGSGEGAKSPQASSICVVS
jgi:ankyrin repeat protein